MNTSSSGKKSGLAALFGILRSHKILCLGILLLFAAVFSLEAVTPKGFAHGTLYIPICMLAVLMKNRQCITCCAAAAVGLTVIGYGISPDLDSSVSAAYAVMNRFVSVAALAITGILAVKGTGYLESEQRARSDLEKAQESLSERERYFSSLLYNIHEDIVVIDENYQIIDVNNTYVHTAGRKREDVIGRKCYEMSHGYGSPCSEHNESCMLKTVFQTGEYKNCSHVHYRRDGTPIYTDILLSPIKDSEGRVTHVVEAIRDVTDIMTWEKEMRKQDTLLQMAGKLAKFGGWYFDLKENQVIWSEQVASIFETPPDYIPGKEEALNFYAPEYQGIIRSRIDSCIEEGIPFDEELQIITRNGRRVWVRAMGNPVTDESGTVAGMQGGIQDITERKRTEQIIAEKEAHFQALIEGSPVPIFVQTELQFAYLNRAACDLFGAETQEDLLGTPVMERFHPSVREIVAERIRKLNKQREAVPEIEETYLRLDGSEVQVEVSAVPISFKGRQGAVVFAKDITEKKKAEQEQEVLRSQLVQAQKMESVGRLAGGVAHDYNNMLGVIIGYCELALEQLNSDDPVKQDLDEIYKAAQRSSSITQQLLAFARKQTISPHVIDVNKTLGAMMNMLRRVAGETVTVSWEPKEPLWPILLDTTQLHQVMMNLVLNAKDAVGASGRITIETDTAVADEKYCSNRLEFVPGEYVIIEVSDDGEGIDKMTLESIFDPFFTTKGEKGGSGLGLPMVYGIVRQNKGYIHVYSEPGKGTTVKLYFPHHQGEPAEELPAEKQSDVPAGEVSVLVVEDDEAILRLTAALLERLGYHVFSAGTPEEAKRTAEQQEGSIDVLVTDVVMPEMSGKELSEALQQLCPNMRTLFMSGYTANVITHRGVLDKGVHFIQKPFSISELAEKLEGLLT